MSRIDDRPSIKKASQETIYFALGNSIKTRSWLVENEHFRITDNSSSQCEDRKSTRLNSSHVR